MLKDVIDEKTQKIWKKSLSEDLQSVLSEEFDSHKWREREFILPSRLQMQDCQMNNDSQTSIKPQ